MILVEFISFLTYITRFKANITLFIEKYTNENAINFTGSCFVYIKKSVVLLMIDCHHKLAKWLCQSYRIILLPKFQTQGMVRRGKRRIRSKTARMMLTWSTSDFANIFYIKFVNIHGVG